MRYKEATLALGGGGLKGAAHIGVLKVFEEERLPIGSIAGSSAGALVGAWYGVGYSASELKQLVLGYVDNPPLDLRIKPLRAMWTILTTLFNMLRIGYLPTERALILGKRLDEYLYNFFGGISFDDLRLPLMITAVELQSGRLQVFTNQETAKKLKNIHDIDVHADCDLAMAVRASIAIPAIFEPVNYKGMILVDGGVKDLVPVDILRFADCANIIGVDLGTSNQPDDQLDDLLAIIMQTIEVMGEELADMILERYADLVLRPKVDGIRLTDFHRLAEVYERGYREAQRKLNAIKMLLKGRW